MLCLLVMLYIHSICSCKLFFLLHYTVSPKKEATKLLAIRKIFILFSAVKEF